MNRRIAIVTAARDLHARAVAHELRSSGRQCSLIIVDSLTRSNRLCWQSHAGGRTLVPTTEGPIDVSTLDAIWWRRFNAVERIIVPQLTDGQIDVIRNDCKTTLRGILLTEFSGSWVSRPIETELADNKLIQLRAAAAAGFAVPRTLVSNDSDQIRQFCRMLAGQVVVKVVHGSKTSGGIATRMINDEVLEDTECLRACPTIYQEYVPGNQHIRAHIFGEEVHSVILESERVDWRVDHTTPIASWETPPQLSAMLRSVVNNLGLRMGIVDLKLTSDGQPIWLELNPQGAVSIR